MTDFTALLQPAANVQGLLGTFADTRHNTVNYTCLSAVAVGTEETAQARGREAPSDDSIATEWKCWELLKPGREFTIHTDAVGSIWPRMYLRSSK